MKFNVVWTPTAEEDLASVWTEARDRDAVTSAAHTIDRLLSLNADSIGEIRFDTVRSLSVAPLGVDYEVIEADRLVFVLAAWDSSRSNGT